MLILNLHFTVFFKEMQIHLLQVFQQIQIHIFQFFCLSIFGKKNQILCFLVIVHKTRKISENKLASVCKHAKRTIAFFSNFAERCNFNSYVIVQTENSCYQKRFVALYREIAGIGLGLIQRLSISFPIFRERMLLEAFLSQWSSMVLSEVKPVLLAKVSLELLVTLVLPRI